MSHNSTSGPPVPDSSPDPRPGGSDVDEKRARFCLNTCPGCKTARKKQKGFWFQAVRVSDDKLCPWCSSYTRTTGLKAYEPIPGENDHGQGDRP